MGACVGFPEVVSYRQDAAHEDQESKNLQGEFSEDKGLS